MSNKYKRAINIWLKLATSLFGSFVEVVYSKNEGYVGLKGKIIDETEKMLFVEMESTKKTICIPKKGQVFRINLNDKVVLVRGEILLGKPHQRMKKKIKLW